MPELPEVEVTKLGIAPDELVEVTPKNIRLRKRILNATERKRSNR